MAVGTFIHHANTELLDVETLSTWSNDTEHYPYHRDISFAPIIYHNGSFYILGGRSEKENPKITSTIAKYSETDRQWTKSGSLQRRRFGHNAIVNTNYIMVFGGIEERAPEEIKSEKCVILGEIYCSEQEPTLKTEGLSNGFWNYPEVFNLQN